MTDQCGPHTVGRTLPREAYFGRCPERTVVKSRQPGFRPGSAPAGCVTSGKLLTCSVHCLTCKWAHGDGGVERAEQRRVSVLVEAACPEH